MGLDCVASLGFVPKIRVQFMGRANFLWIFLPKKEGNPLAKLVIYVAEKGHSLVPPESGHGMSGQLVAANVNQSTFYTLPAYPIPKQLTTVHIAIVTFCLWAFAVT